MTRFRPQDKTQKCVYSKRFEPCLPANHSIILKGKQVKLCAKHYKQILSIDYPHNFPILFQRQMNMSKTFTVYGNSGKIKAWNKPDTVCNFCGRKRSHHTFKEVIVCEKEE